MAFDGKIFDITDAVRVGDGLDPDSGILQRHLVPVSLGKTVS